MKNFLTCILCAFLLTACDDKDEYNVEKDGTYEKAKESLEEKEKKNPASFLRATGADKRNLLGQTVVKGNIYNNAKIVAFKDVEIRMDFFSKTGALLEQDRVTVYETVNPGGSKSFKTKYFAPKGTDSVAMTVTGAKF